MNKCPPSKYLVGLGKISCRPRLGPQPCNITGRFDVVVKACFQRPVGRFDSEIARQAPSWIKSTCFRDVLSTTSTNRLLSIVGMFADANSRQPAT